jgi:hypothetical protein
MNSRLRLASRSRARLDRRREEVTQEVEAEEIVWVAGRAAGGFGFDTRESEVFQVKVRDIRIEEADRIFLGDGIPDGIRHEGYLKSLKKSP